MNTFPQVAIPATPTLSTFRPRPRRRSKWARIPEPPAGARYRGYLRYSERDLKTPTAEKTTFLMQRAEIDAYAKARGWVCAGWDEEPAITGAAEEIALRPAFQRHLDAAAAGRFDISLCHMSDRWARDTAIGLDSLKRLRRAGVYWATADGKWDINKVIEDGFSIAFVVDQEVNASYARKISQKALDAHRQRARAGYHNGRVAWGYRRPPRPAPPPDAPYNWRPEAMPAEPHPMNFPRLQQIGAWAAAGLSDREIAARAEAAGWILEHRIKGKGVVGWGKPFIRALITTPFPREFAPGSGHGTIVTPDGQRIEGKHPAAWDWDLWQRIDAARGLNRHGTRGRAPTAGQVRLFSGLAVCAGCGRALHHQVRRSRVSGPYSVYLCAAAQTGYACPVRSAGGIKTGKLGTRGFRGVRSRTLEDAFAALVLDWDLPPDWREQIAAEINRAQDGGRLEEALIQRADLHEQRKRILVQHQYGRISDEEMLAETARLDALLAVLPSPERWEFEKAAHYSAADTLARQRDYWDQATAEQRAEALRLIVEPSGLVVDLREQTITRIKPRAALLPMFRVVLADRWREGEEGWLLRVA
jgi:DNA invertase Pin-like site-specific DNA recombinase